VGGIDGEEAIVSIDCFRESHGGHLIADLVELCSGVHRVLREVDDPVGTGALELLEVELVLRLYLHLN